MHRSSFSKLALLIVVFAAIVGCDSQKNKSVASGGTSAAPTAAAPASGEGKYLSGQNTMGAPTASPQDQAAVRGAAALVLSRMESGDFAAIYNEASAGFQKLGSRDQFIAAFSQTGKKTGALKKPQEVSFTSGPNNTHVIIYRLENDKFHTDRRLSFSHSPNGAVILEGLNQHDEPIK